MIYSCFISFSITNCFVTVLKEEGGVFMSTSWGEERKIQFKGSKKGLRKLDNIFGFTLGTRVGLKLRREGVSKVRLYLSNPLSYRVRQYILGLRKVGISLQINHFYKTAHNGCRPKKKRRV